MTIPRTRRYPMRPISDRLAICRAFDVPPNLINHTARPVDRWSWDRSAHARRRSVADLIEGQLWVDGITVSPDGVLEWRQPWPSETIA